jgi:hypothetical protein
MEPHKLGLSILAIVSVLALSALVLLAMTPTGLYIYEQPSNRHPVYLQNSMYLDNFNLCMQYLCDYGGDTFYAEVEPAFPVGTESLTGNLRCGCSDGREFIIRPDRIEEGAYP